MDKQWILQREAYERCKKLGSHCKFWGMTVAPTPGLLAYSKLIEVRYDSLTGLSYKIGHLTDEQLIELMETLVTLIRLT